MKKIAIIGSIHEDGINYLKTSNFECFEIEDLSKNRRHATAGRAARMSNLRARTPKIQSCKIGRRNTYQMCGGKRRRRNKNFGNKIWLKIEILIKIFF